MLAFVANVGQQALAATNHLQQALAGGEVVRVLLQVTTELGNSLAQHGHLNLHGARVGAMGLMGIDELLLLSGIERHAWLRAR